jgi:hypothetical protein
MSYLLRLLVSVTVLVLIAAVAGAQEPQKEAVIQEITLRGTVEAVDHKARIVKVRSDQGNIVTLDVPASYTRFDQVRAGDIVSITYYDRVSVRLKPAGEPPVDRVSDPATTTTLAPTVGGTRVVQRISTVTIDAWDPATRIVSFTNTAGQSFTRRVVETLDASVLAGIKVGDRVDVTRTEATNIAVVTPAPAAAAPQVAAVETFGNRFTISVLWGPESSVSGDIAQSGSGSFEGGPINFVDTSFDSVYGTMTMLKIGVGYRTSPRSEVNFNFVYSTNASGDVEIGTIGPENAPLSVKFDDYEYWGIEGGQRFYFSRVRFTPFVGYTVGINRFSAINGNFSSPATGPQPLIVRDGAPFFEESWTLSAGFTGGLLVGMGPIELLVESGFRYMGGLADVAPLQETGLANINDTSSRWSIPFLFGLRIRF